MITTSVETRDVTELRAKERFRVDPPASSPFFVSDAMQVTHSAGATEVLPVPSEDSEESRLAEEAYDALVEEAVKEASSFPTNSRSHVKLGLALLNRGNTALARESFERALVLEPNNYVALSSLASAALGSGELGEATILFRRAAEAYPLASAPHIALASIAIRMQDFIAATDSLRTAIRLDHSLDSAHYLLAMVHLRLDKPREAVSVLRDALRRKPRSAELQQGLAVAFLVLGDTRRAERAFHSALTLQPSFAPAIHGLAQMLLHQGRTKDVVELLLSRLMSFPDDLQGREMLAHAYVRENDYGRARSQLISIIDSTAFQERVPENERARLYNNVGFCLVREERWPEAEVYLTKAIETGKGFSSAPYENLAKALLTNSKPAKALELLNLASRRGVETTAITTLRATSYVRLREFDAAIAEFTKVVADADGPATAFADLGWLLSDWAGDNDSAIDVLNKALDKFGPNPLILNNLAYVHLLKGETEPARMLIELMPPDKEKLPQMLATKGLLLLWAGETAEGELMYKKAEELAASLGDRPLMFAVRQKKYLELARAFTRIGRVNDAMQAITTGLQVPVPDLPLNFRDEILQLGKSVSNRSLES